MQESELQRTKENDVRMGRAPAPKPAARPCLHPGARPCPHPHPGARAPLPGMCPTPRRAPASPELERALQRVQWALQCTQMATLRTVAHPKALQCTPARNSGILFQKRAPQCIFM
ncbi:hypothetical protein L484_007927 [Morus notabilis]|uniref:Uncharacterized protein n=1 Tax=Morus notabilis TaxID=981085 RepID=W9QXV9_9ROSA|nr:hypothetical protein L484_007927 [Morus notabilis]